MFKLRDQKLGYGRLAIAMCQGGSVCDFVIFAKSSLKTAYPQRTLIMEKGKQGIELGRGYRRHFPLG